MYAFKSSSSAAWERIRFCFTFWSSSSMTAASLLSTHFQQLDAFRKDHLTVYALSCDEADLTVSGIELVQALNRSAGAIGDPVVVEVTKSNGQRAGFNGRHIGAGVN